MKTSADIRSIDALESLKTALARFDAETVISLQAIDLQVQRTLDWLHERMRHWEAEVRRRQAAVQLAAAEMSRCEASGYTDVLGSYHAPECGDYANALRQAMLQLERAELELTNARKWLVTVQQAVQSYQIQCRRLKDILGTDLPKAAAILARKAEILRDYASRDTQLQANSSLMAPLPRIGGEVGGGHGSVYRSARQEFLRGLVDDTRQPSYVRGWVKQELNRLSQVKKASERERKPPGGNRRHVRGIPGLDVGHRFPGIDLPGNLRLEDVFANRGRPGRARRLGLSRLR